MTLVCKAQTTALGLSFSYSLFLEELLCYTQSSTYTNQRQFAHAIPIPKINSTGCLLSIDVFKTATLF